MTTNLAAFLFCDDFVTDSSNKGANSIFNVVESLQSDQLPCISSGAFYYALRGLEGEHTFKVTRQQPNLEFVTILEKTHHFTNPTSLSTITHRKIFIFQEEGIYLFHAWLNNKIIGEYAITISLKSPGLPAAIKLSSFDETGKLAINTNPLDQHSIIPQSRLAAFLICKSFSVDRHSGASLFVIIPNLVSNVFPFSYNCGVYFAVRNCQGKHMLKVTGKAPNGTDFPVCEVKNLDFNNPLSITYILQRCWVEFKEIGGYQFYAWLNDEIIGEYAISVSKIAKNDSPDDNDD